MQEDPAAGIVSVRGEPAAVLQHGVPQRQAHTGHGRLQHAGSLFNLHFFQNICRYFLFYVLLKLIFLAGPRSRE